MATVQASRERISQFSDMQDHWAAPQVEKWLIQGMISGYPDGTFQPDHAVSRAEFVTLANRAFGFSPTTLTGFTDVVPDAWYAADLGAAALAGYINGYPDGTFRPQNPVDRQEAAVMLARILQISPSPDAILLTKFKDFTSLAAWSKGYVHALAATGLATGYPDGTFQPQQPSSVLFQSLR